VLVQARATRCPWRSRRSRGSSHGRPRVRQSTPPPSLNGDKRHDRHLVPHHRGTPGSDLPGPSLSTSSSQFVVHCAGRDARWGLPPHAQALDRGRLATSDTNAIAEGQRSPQNPPRRLRRSAREANSGPCSLSRWRRKRRRSAQKSRSRAGRLRGGASVRRRDRAPGPRRLLTGRAPRALSRSLWDSQRQPAYHAAAASTVVVMGCPSGRSTSPKSARRNVAIEWRRGAVKSMYS